MSLTWSYLLITMVAPKISVQLPSIFTQHMSCFDYFVGCSLDFSDGLPSLTGRQIAYNKHFLPQCSSFYGSSCVFSSCWINVKTLLRLGKPSLYESICPLIGMKPSFRSSRNYNTLYILYLKFEKLFQPITCELATIRTHWFLDAKIQ